MDSVKKIFTFFLLFFFTSVRYLPGENNEHPLWISNFSAYKSLTYVGTWGTGVYYLSNQSLLWEPLNQGLTHKFIYSLVANDRCLLVGTDGGGIFRFDQSTQSWQPINNGLENLVIFSIFEKNSVLIATTWQNGLYRSIDNGDSWKKMKGSINNYTFYAVNAKNNNFYAGGSATGLFQSRDRGLNWEKIGLAGISILCIYPIGNSVWLGTWKNGIYCYMDETKEWNNIPTVFEGPVHAIALSQDYQTIYCANRTHGIYSSPDSGKTWSPTGLNEYNVTSLISRQNRIIAGTWGDGIYYLDNGDTTWRNEFQKVTQLPDIQSPNLTAESFPRKEQRQKLTISSNSQQTAIPVYQSKQRSTLLLNSYYTMKLLIYRGWKEKNKVEVLVHNNHGMLEEKKVVFINDDDETNISLNNKRLNPGVYIVSISSKIDRKKILIYIPEKSNREI